MPKDAINKRSSTRKDFIIDIYFPNKVKRNSETMTDNILELGTGWEWLFQLLDWSLKLD